MRTGSPMSSTNTSRRARRAVRASARARSEPRADDQLDRLGDRHEVARHALVGDGDRAAALDLAAEDRHDAAGGAEHVAEAHRRVARARESAPWRPPARTRRAPSTRPSRSPARPPCRSRRARSGATPSSPGDVRDHARGDRVVAHRLHRVGLHQADVLVGGGVEHDRRAVLGEDLAHALLLLAVGEHRREHRGRDVALVLAARAGSRRGCPRRGRAARSGAARRARSGGTAPSRSSRPRPVTSTVSPAR